MDLLEVNHKLKLRLAEYRMARKNSEVSFHINAIEIVTCLIALAIEIKRPLTIEDREWFRAGYYVSYVLDNSEWEDISDMYSQICDYVIKRDYQLES